MRLIGVFILTIILVGILGCDTNDPLSAEEEEVVEEEILMAKGAEIVSSSAIAAAAPSIVKRVAMSDTLMVSLSHEETESDGDEIVGVTADNGALLAGDRIYFYANDEYIGRVTLPSGDSWKKVHIRLKDKVLPQEEVTIAVVVHRNSSVVAKASVVINRVVIGPYLESVESRGSNEVTLIFSDDVNASREMRSNTQVVANAKALSIWSHGEDGCEITLIMRKNLMPGEHKVTYNGKGGLESLQGNPVDAFSTTFEIEGAVADTVRGTGNQGTVPAKAETADDPPDPPWKVIHKGIYISGTQILTVLDMVKVKVSQWARNILKNPDFQVEKVQGTVDVYLVTAADLGLQAPYTAMEVIIAAIQNGYHLLPAEIPATTRLVYRNQPNGEIIVFITRPLYDPVGKRYCLLMNGHDAAVAAGKWLSAVDITSPMGEEYNVFAVGKETSALPESDHAQ